MSDKRRFRVGDRFECEAGDGGIIEIRWSGSAWVPRCAGEEGTPLATSPEEDADQVSHGGCWGANGHNRPCGDDVPKELRKWRFVAAG
jgi:hypothetical protein